MEIAFFVCQNVQPVARLMFRYNTESIFSVRGIDGDNRSCGVRADMPGGNVVVIIGQSLPFMDQTSQAVKDLGAYIIGTEFGETK